MLRKFLIALALACMSLSGVSPATSTATAADVERWTGYGRGMWVWTTPDPDLVVPFARSIGVTELYVHVSPHVMTDGSLSQLRALVRGAQAAGLRVSALGGDPQWVNDADQMRAWYAAVNRTGLFRRVHIDVEPWALPGWDDPSTRRVLVRRYVRLVERMRARDLALNLDVIYWMHEVPYRRNNLAVAIARRVRDVTVMSYIDRGVGPDSIMSVSSRWRRIARRTGLRYRLSSETNPIPVRRETFWYRGFDALQRAQASAEESVLAGRNPGYQGMSVHDFDASFRLLRGYWL